MIACSSSRQDNPHSIQSIAEESSSKLFCDFHYRLIMYNNHNLILNYIFQNIWCYTSTNLPH